MGLDNGLTIVSNNLQSNNIRDIDRFSDNTIFRAKIGKGSNDKPITAELSNGLLISDSDGRKEFTVSVFRREGIVPSFGGVGEIKYCNDMNEYTNYTKRLFAPYQSILELQKLFELDSWDLPWDDYDNRRSMFLMVHDRASRCGIYYFGLQDHHGNITLRDGLMALRFPCCVWNGRHNRYVFPILLSSVSSRDGCTATFSFDSGTIFDPLSLGGDATAVPSIVFDKPLSEDKTSVKEITKILLS